MSLRQTYDNDLARLDDAVRRMGDGVQTALYAALNALTACDKDTARRIIAGDHTIDGQEREIEHLCMTLLLRQQPVAGDLRRISGTLKMVTDLERMGDHAADIAEISLCHSDAAPLPHTLSEMGAGALEMERNAINAFLAGDTAAAAAVIAADDAQDARFEAIKREIADRLAATPTCADEMLDLLMIAKYLERVADHSVNVAEWTIFCQTGLYKNEPIV